MFQIPCVFLYCYYFLRYDGDVDTSISSAVMIYIVEQQPFNRLHHVIVGDTLPRAMHTFDYRWVNYSAHAKQKAELSNLLTSVCLCSCV